MRASRSSELRSRLGPMAKIMGEVELTGMEERRQWWQVPLTVIW
jgi:hypothetical protein